MVHYHLFEVDWGYVFVYVDNVFSQTVEVRDLVDVLPKRTPIIVSYIDAYDTRLADKESPPQYAVDASLLAIREDSDK